MVAGSVPVMVTSEIAHVSLEEGEVSPNEVQRKLIGVLSLGSATVWSTWVPVASPPPGPPAMVAKVPKSSVSPCTEACITPTESPDVVASGLKSE